MIINLIKRVACVAAVFFGVGLGLMAQEKNDAIKAFNAAVELMKTDAVGSIGSFENCIKICEQIGDSAYDIQVKVEQVLPGLYFQKANNLLTVDKKIDEAIAASKKTVEIAEKYNNAGVKERTERILVQAYSNKAAVYVANKEIEKAIQTYDSVLAISPDHQASLYNKALMYRGIDNGSKFSETIDLYISKLKTPADTAKIEQAQKIARDYFRIAGGKSNQAAKYDEAMDLLTTASKYGYDKNLYYQYASMYNKQKKYSLAAENAQKGLELETGKPEDKAKFYFELAEAQFNQGQKDNACESYKNAKFGPFVQAATAQLKNLQCQ